MAVVAMNDITTGLRGKFGNHFVFRIMRGKTFVSRRARKPDRSKESVSQRSTRDRFRRASAWAKQFLSDPEKKKIYVHRARELNLPNAYTAAIKEYMCREDQIQISDDSYFSVPAGDLCGGKTAPTTPCSLKTADSKSTSELRSLTPIISNFRYFRFQTNLSDVTGSKGLIRCSDQSVFDSGS